MLELPDVAVARLLDLLDGTRSERTVIAHAGRYAIREAHARALLETLRAAGLVVGAQTLFPPHLPGPVRHRLADEAAALALRGTDPPTTPAQALRRRSAARVVVTGHGQLVAPVALALAQAGVGHVAPARDRVAADAAAGRAGDGAGAELAEAIGRAAPGTKTGPLRRREASFVVQVGPTGPANLTAAGYARHRLAHLAVTVRDGTVVVGPLVPPAGGPCLYCVDLHRQDRDPGWPGLAAQLAAPASDPCAAATVLCAAGLAAGEVLGWLDGGTPSTLGASIEITTPGTLRRRSWPPHPRCHCHRPPRRRTRPQPGGGPGAGSSGRGTMGG